MADKLRLNKYCMQSLDELEMLEIGCTYSKCRHCGHNRNVWQYRRKLIEKYGLTKCDDGLWRLIVPTRRRKEWQLETTK